MLADQTLSLPKGILKNLYVRVGTLYAPADFVVIEAGTDEREPIILGRPFLNTSGAVIYASAAKISFYIKGSVDIWERNKELIHKRTDIGEHFTREVIQSIVFIFLPLGERVHLTNRSITTNTLGNKECLSM